MSKKRTSFVVLVFALASSLACQLFATEPTEDKEDLKATIAAQRTVIAEQAKQLGGLQRLTPWRTVCLKLRN
ncbi:MAG: hypothetical protein ISS49_07620 [Anaerolineae bacterium]|nr:hypothetical protein [Anaerolineae bacterium]